jgi:hypothetical protein
MIGRVLTHTSMMMPTLGIVLSSIMHTMMLYMWNIIIAYLCECWW